MGWMTRDPAEPELSSDLDRALKGLGAKLQGCPSPDLLQASQAGVLPLEKAQEIDQHLQRCSVCRSLLADLAELDAAGPDRAEKQRIWASIQSRLSDGVGIKKARWWWRPLPVASALACVATVMIVAVLLVRDHQPAAVPVAQSHPAAIAQQPSVFKLEKAPIILPASAALVWRGQEDGSARPANDLKKALFPYQSGNYQEAVKRLDGLRKKYPSMAEAPFYQGVSQLFLNQNDKAAVALNDAVKLGKPPLLTQARWYLAVADYRTGKIEQAKDLLQPECRAGSKDSPRACQAVKELEVRR